jgi:hypothetical protein
MKHLVKHDPRDEEPRHERAIERPVNPDQAILDRVAAHLDRVASTRPTGALTPGDGGVDLVIEVARVELVVELAKIVSTEIIV